MLGIRFAVPFAVIALTSTLLHAQSGNGVVKGTVVDATKGFVAGASTSLRNTSTGIVREAKTNDAGVYYFGALPPPAVWAPPLR